MEIEKILGKLRNQNKILSQYVFEREEIIETLNLALLSNQHLCIISKPGLAKSLLGDLKSRFISNSVHAMIFCNSYLKPSEILGPLSIQELKAGKQIYMTKNYAPDAHILTMEEVFKAEKQLSICLPLLNERFFMQDGIRVKTPLISALLFSNEMPSDKELNAFWNRVMFRFQVDNCGESDNFQKILNGNFQELENHPEFAQNVVSIDEIKFAQNWIKNKVEISQETGQVIETIFRICRSEGIECSDRQVRWTGQIIRVVAALDNRTKTIPEDAEFLKNVLWNDPGKDKQTVFKIVIENCNKELVAILKAMDTSTVVIRNWMKSVKEGIAIDHHRIRGELDECKSDIDKITPSAKNQQEYNRAVHTTTLNHRKVSEWMRENKLQN